MPDFPEWVQYLTEDLLIVLEAFVLFAIFAFISKQAVEDTRIKGEWIHVTVTALLAPLLFYGLDAFKFSLPGYLFAITFTLSGGYFGIYKAKSKTHEQRTSL